MLLGKIEIGSIVRIKKTGEFAKIIGKNQLLNRPDSFLNYYCEIEGRMAGSIWAMYDHMIELECLPLAEDKS